jgi:hypothetical protein
MTRLARVAIDSINSNSHLIPDNVFAVGGYISDQSSFKWSAAQWDLFPDSYHIRINTFGEKDRGNCLDVERGAATIREIQPWIENHGGEPHDPLLVYCNRSNRDAATTARDAAYKASGNYAFIWCATLDGTLTDNAMTQILQVKTESGRIYGDLSVIFDQRLLDAMVDRAGKQ